MAARGRETRADLERTHSPAAIRRRLGRPRRHSYLSDGIFGAIDGAVTTFAVVAGVTGAGLSAGVIVILGAANLLGDGFSMAAANFLGARAARQQHEHERRLEEREIELHPEGEREEIRQIFARKGFTGALLEQVVGVITGDRKRWIDTMMTEEHGAAQELRSPWRAGAATFAAFAVVGAIPLLPFAGVVVGALSLPERPFLWSAAMTAAAFFLVGAAKSRFVDQRWWLSGLETLGVGSVAAALAFAAGVLLGGLVRAV